MTQLALLCGAPGSSLLLFARELDTAPQARVLFPWNLGGALEALGNATRERALAWRGPVANELPWIERSLELAAPALVEALLERERLARPAIEFFALGHFALARHAPRLARALPGALFVLCGTDGRVAPSGRIPAGDARAEALAGLEWARQWSASIAPLVECAAQLGERLVVIGEDELAADPARAKQLFLGAQAGEWRTTRPWKRERIAGAALAGFACSRAARELQRALGHETPDPDAEALAIPELALEFARGLLEQGDHERAHDLLRGASAEGVEDALRARSETLAGRIALARGDRARALALWRAAIARAPEEPEAWEQLFALRDEPATEALASRARRSSVARVRHALARWLVAHGLDPEAAEIAARVEHHEWAKPPGLHS